MRQAYWHCTDGSKRPIEGQWSGEQACSDLCSSGSRYECLEDDRRCASGSKISSEEQRISKAVS